MAQYALTPVGGDPFASDAGVDYSDPVTAANAAAARDAAQHAYAVNALRANPSGNGLSAFQSAAVNAMPSDWATLRGGETLAQAAGDPTRPMYQRIGSALGAEGYNLGAGMLSSAYGAATLPGDVATGRVDPSSPEAIRRSTDLAGMLTMPAATSGAGNPNVMAALAGGIDPEAAMARIQAAIEAYPKSPPEIAPLAAPAKISGAPSIQAGNSPFEVMLHNAGMSQDDFAKSMLGQYGKDASGKYPYYLDDGYDKVSFDSPLFDQNSGRKIGNVSRFINPSLGSAYHNLFELNNNVQGAGVGKDILQNHIDTYNQLGINKIGTFANIDVGAYAWSKYGFLPPPHEWNNLKGGVYNRAEALEQKGLLDPTIADQVYRLAVNYDPKSLWKISDLQPEVPDIYQLSQPTTTLGKYLLKGNSWHGVLDLTDPASMARFNNYIKKSSKSQ